MDFIFIGGWLVCGVLAAYLYQRKGRSGFVAFLGGALLGPFGVVLALLSGDSRPKCPYCKERHEQGATVCPHCRRDLLSGGDGVKGSWGAKEEPKENKKMDWK
jgi:hypothetical protein